SKILELEKTTIVFDYNGATIKTYEYSAPLGDPAPVPWQNEMPQGYHVVTQPTIVRGRSNTISIAPNRQSYTFTLIFKFNNNEVKRISGTYYSDEEKNVNEYVPQGYKLANPSQATEFPRNATKEYQVVKVVNSNNNPEVTPPNRRNDEPVDVNRALSKEGQRVDLNNLNIPTKPGLPQPKKTPLTAAEKQKIRDQVNGFVRLLDSNVDLTVENLREFFPHENEEDEIRLESYVRWINGKSNLQTYGRKLTKEEIRRDLRIGWTDALNYLETAAATGQILHTNIMASEWGYNTQPIWGPRSDAENAVVQWEIKQNESLTLGNSSKWQRDPQKIIEGRFDGWGKYDETESYINQGLTGARVTGYEYVGGKRVRKNDGLRVFTYKPDANNAIGIKKGNMKLLEVDASNPKGYDKWLNFLKNNTDIKMLRIKSIGEADKNESLRSLLEQLPSHVTSVELFFATKDTSAMSGLKNKVLDNVGLYTTIPNIDEEDDRTDWGIDPIALLNTKFVPATGRTLRSFTPQAAGDRAESIQFNTIRPSKTDSFEDVRRGFEIALKTKEDWRIFNGRFGSGSWPSYIDLSLNPQLRSLKGLPLNQRVFQKLTLHNQGEIYELPFGDLAVSQFGSLVVSGPDRPRLQFNDASTHILYISGNPNDLQDGWGKQLYGLLEAGTSADGRKQLPKAFDTLYVDSEDAARVIRSSQAWGLFGSKFENGIKVKPAQ
ncbi:putative immunoglobulin-blocking virulence protein, partial [Mycoplasma nasistruthionis]|uniref:putative immunoglobulin-blocking virulence protein n=1 Tax=Mycoplasma nasistruthionis TaxID=353852 RepID=UPI001ABF369C